jgi:acetyl-CoA carboxylase carboxyltransferase component
MSTIQKRTLTIECRCCGTEGYYEDIKDVMIVKKENVITVTKHHVVKKVWKRHHIMNSGVRIAM